MKRLSAAALLMALAVFLLMATPQRATAVGTPYLVKTSEGNSVKLDILNSRRPMGTLGNSVLLTASDSTNGYELWRSDGTETGTHLVKDINPGPADSYPSQFVSLNGKVLFTATDGVHGRGLWISDGTDSGTTLLKDIYPGGNGAACWNHLVVHNGFLYFNADTTTSKSTLWKTDGTPEGTLPVKEIYPGNDRLFERIIEANGQLLIFIRLPDGLTKELWKSDGTAEGTVLVTSIPGDMLNYMTACNGRVFFDLHAVGSALWVSDGTALGTFKLKSTPTAGDPSAQGMACAGNSLIFRAEDLNGVEPWKSDGTVAGTAMVKDINPGPAESNPSYFGGLNGKAFFSAGNNSSGMELWLSDGTESGTIVLKDINPGPGSSKIDYNGFYSANGKGFFLADNGINGQQIFVTNGTTDGTFSLGNTIPGNFGSFMPKSYNYQVAGDTLFFSSVNQMNSMGLWAVSLAPAPHSVISAPAWRTITAATVLPVIGEAHSDTGSPIAKVEVSSDNGQTWSLADGTTSWQYAFTAPGEGVYTIRSRATDQAGQVETTGPSAQVTIDQSPPTGSLLISTPSASGQVTLTISANGTVPGVSCPPASPQICGVVYISLSNDGINWFSILSQTSYTHYVSTGNGTKTVYMRLKDEAGNLANFSASIEVNNTPVPPAPPSSLILQPANNSFTNLATVTITGMATPGSGASIQRVEVSTDGGTTWQTASGTISWSFLWYPAAGSYTIKSRAVDTFGQTEIPLVSTLVTIDRTPPMGMISSNYQLNAPDGLQCFAFPCVNSNLSMLLPGSSTWQPATTVLPLGTTSLYLRDRAGNTALITQMMVQQQVLLEQPSPVYYSLVQPACDNALSGNIIKLVGTSFTENLMLTKDIAVTLRGGYDSNHGMMTGTSIINGTLRASAGTTTLENLEIHGNVTIDSGILVPANVTVL